MSQNFDQPTGGPIFVVGYIHTGTSLLKTILKRNPDVWPLAGETHFFQDLAVIKREFADLSNPATRRAYLIFLIKLAYLGFKRGMWRREEWSLTDFGLNEAQLDELLAATAGIDTHEVLFARVGDWLAAAAGKSRWIEKTPEHVYYLDAILRHIPDAKVIELVRDPRATLASRKVRQTVDEWLDTREVKKGVEVDRMTNYDPVLDSMMWKEAINAGRESRRARPRNILTVRYEDLVGDPITTVQKICQFTGLAYSDDLLEVGWVNAASQMPAAGTTAQLQKAGISTAAVEKWRQTLGADEIFLCQQLLRTEMRELGYEPAAVALGPRLQAPFLFAHTGVRLAQRLGKGRRSPERAKDAFGRIQRRLLKNLGVQR
jgi:hypothetical protein